MKKVIRGNSETVNAEIYLLQFEYQISHFLNNEEKTGIYTLRTIVCIQSKPNKN